MTLYSAEREAAVFKMVISFYRITPKSKM